MNYKATTIINGKSEEKEYETLAECMDDKEETFDINTNDEAERRKDQKITFYITRLADDAVLLNFSLNYFGTKIKPEEFPKD